MKHNYLIIILTLFLWTTASSVSINSTSNLSEVFQNSIPTKLKGNLQLIEVKNRCDDCNPWRYIDYYSNESQKPIKREKVSVLNGYRAMYAYPNSHYFSNTKIEQSIPNEYLHDKKIVIEAIKHEFNRKKEQIYSYLNKHPELKTKMAPYKAKNKDYMELEENNYKGYEYISYTENVIGLTGNTISQIHIFVPNKQIIVTAYLLNQKKTHFKTINEFLKLRDDFIESYIDFLEEHIGSN